jgi:Flp pilus assembly CpaE family ATPase
MPEKILVIDDDVDNRRLLLRTLGKAGYDVIEAGDGNEGLALAFGLLPELILLDVVMPELDGYQICEILKKDPRTTDIPIIFLSAKTEAKDKIKGLEIGGVDYITKPFDRTEVLARVQTQLKNRLLIKEMMDKQKHLEEDLRASETLHENILSTKTLSFLGCKGGVGTTFLAANLAYLLSLEQQGQVLLVDLDLQYAQMIYFFDVKPQYTLGEAIANLDEMDNSFLQSLLYSYNKFISLLPAPARLEEAETFTAEHLDKILSKLKSMQAFRWIIVDAGHRMDEITAKALELSDILVLVTAPSVPALNNTKKWLELLQLLELELPMDIWLNGWDRTAGLTLSDISKFLKFEVHTTLPFDPAAVNQSINEGHPLAETDPRHRLCKILQIKAKGFVDKEDRKEATASGWDWLKRLGGKSKS